MAPYFLHSDAPLWFSSLLWIIPLGLVLGIVLDLVLISLCLVLVSSDLVLTIFYGPSFNIFGHSLSNIFGPCFYIFRPCSDIVLPSFNAFGPSFHMPSKLSGNWDLYIKYAQIHSALAQAHSISLALICNILRLTFKDLPLSPTDISLPTRQR